MEPKDNPIDEYIERAKACLNYPPGMVDGSSYMIMQRHLAMLNLLKEDESQAIYHLTEAHGAGMRQICILQEARACVSGRTETGSLDTEFLSFHNDLAKEEYNGVLMRLKEMPSEWTIVQLTREFDKKDVFGSRHAESSPQVRGLHVTRLPCGTELDFGLPVTIRVEWPDTAAKDLINVFWNAKKDLSLKVGSSSHIKKVRINASAEVENYLREIGPSCLTHWLVLFLGKVCDKQTVAAIKSKLDFVFSTFTATKRQKYLSYLLAAGSCHLTDAEMMAGVHEIFSEDEEQLSLAVYETLLEVKERLTGKLLTGRRHSVLLILDDHLDIVPWESTPMLKRHPVSRVPCLHFAHALFRLHKPYIVNGLREIPDGDVSYYVINPDGDLPSVEEKLGKFIKKRLPNWKGVIGQKPSEQELIDALTTKNAFVYCGHGSGCQYLTVDAIQKLKVRPVQLLYGCSSAALKDHGGVVEMTGDVLQYAIAGSGCTLGMLWPVTSNDTDTMSMVLANLWFPGTPIDPESLETMELKSKESELLRTLRDVRESVHLFSNGAALIARGIPVKLVSKRTEVIEID